MFDKKYALVMTLALGCDAAPETFTFDEYELSESTEDDGEEYKADEGVLDGGADALAIQPSVFSALFTGYFDPILTTAINANPDIVRVGDFNDDGRDDIYFIFGGPGINRLYLSNL